MKMENIPNLLLITIGGMTIAILTLVYSLYVSNSNLSTANKNLDRYDERYQMKQGGTAMYYSDGKWLNYNLATYDGGKIWYAFEYGEDWEVKILGEAETIYPGLMKHIQAWDDLTEHVKKNGTIGKNGLTAKDKQILENASIKVEIK